MQRCLDLSSVGYEDDYEYLLENIDSYDNFLVQLIERNHQRAIDFFTRQIEKNIIVLIVILKGHMQMNYLKDILNLSWITIKR